MVVITLTDIILLIAITLVAIYIGGVYFSAAATSRRESKERAKRAEEYERKREERQKAEMEREYYLQKVLSRVDPNNTETVDSCVEKVGTRATAQIIREGKKIHDREVAEADRLRRDAERKEAERIAKAEAEGAKWSNKVLKTSLTIVSVVTILSVIAGIIMYINIQ